MNLVITHMVHMDLEGKGPVQWVQIPQGDVDTRLLKLALFSGPLPWEVPQNAVVLIRFRRTREEWQTFDTLADGTPAWTADGNMLTVRLPAALLSRPGTVLLYASILLGEQVLNTFAVEIRVAAPGGKEACEEPEEISWDTAVTGFLPAPASAAKGQYFRAAEVSERGKVLRVEAVDPPAGSAPEEEAVQQIVEEWLRENPPANGEDGKSAYAYAREGGYTGTEAEFAQKLAQSPQKAFYVSIVGSYGSYTADRTSVQIQAAYEAGCPVYCLCTMSESGDYGTISVENMIMPLLMDMGGIWIFGAYTGMDYITALLVDGFVQVMWERMAARSEIPGALPNPYALTFTGAVNATYDGRRPVTVEIPEGGTGETIPDYWQTALDEGVAAINSAVENAGRNKSAFLWYNDAHWGYNSGKSPILLKYLQNHTAIKKVNFGGDISNDYEYPDTGKSDDDWMNVMREWRYAVRDLQRHHSVVGNHDQDGTVVNLNDDDSLYGFLMAPEETSDLIRGGDFYYYIDEPSEKTRYLYLSTGFYRVSDEETRFVVDSLKNVPDGWHVIVISHIWFIYDDTSTPTVGSVPIYCQKLLDLFDAYNGRSSGSVTMNSEAITYDFANCTGTVEFCIGGHIHVDYDFRTDGGIPVILTETDSYHCRGESTRTEGTVTEACVSGIVADYGSRKISVIRIGRGSSREVALPQAASYTNVLDTVGYTENMRLSASGGYVEAANEGTDLTGYIPVKNGDIVYLKNVIMPDENAYTNKVYFFNREKTGVNSISMVSTLTAKGVAYQNGNVSQFTVLGTDLSETSGGTGYIRIGAANIDSTSVITVNEPIA